MKKIIQIVMCLAVCALFFLLPVFAEELSNYELTQRVKKLEEQGKGGVLGEWAKHIALSGAIEVEVGFEHMDYTDPAEEDEDSSDMSLATVELGVDAEITKYVSGHVLFLYEDGEDIVIDEGFILLEGKDVLPFSLRAGELYVPFGSFESNMISSPLTADLGETRETAVQLGFEFKGLYAAIYAFNGDIDRQDKEDQIDNFGAAVGFAWEGNGFSLNIGIGYINSLMDSDGWSEALDEELAEAEENGFTFALDNYVDGFEAHAIIGVGPFTLIGEYVTALREPKYNLSDVVPGALAGLGLASSYKGEKPAAWNVELGWTFELAGKEITAGLAYQGTRHAENILPEKRYVGSIGIGLFQGTTLTLEYRHDEFENKDEVGAVTAQLAIEF